MSATNKQFQYAMECLGVRVIKDDYIAWRSCERKQKYSEKRANKIANLLRVKGEKDISSYYCERCYAWHVGHGRSK